LWSWRCRGQNKGWRNRYHNYGVYTKTRPNKQGGIANADFSAFHGNDTIDGHRDILTTNIFFVNRRNLKLIFFSIFGEDLYPIMYVDDIFMPGLEFTNSCLGFCPVSKHDRCPGITK